MPTDLGNKYSSVYTQLYTAHQTADDAQLAHGRWWFNDIDRTLTQNGISVALTRTECSLLSLLAFSSERVVSKEALIAGLGKNPSQYNGLEMSLSRLQSKFGQCSGGERLIRSVRNRGYCLAQVVRSAYCPSWKSPGGQAAEPPCSS
ncbi:response regulator transcription factor [Pseudomonas sp. CFBP 8770]|uniref:Response regulator transcription factor n=1 Tax=Pseudomonas baltica TaxID=2762576 RepID=A0A7X1KTV9_9PSED|nr:MULTISPECIES: winged helix-turn-helix domain-containing protein [Pseudomonas]MBC2679063.1 response regulator transcription factor [Pseudomonas baltica]MBD8473555.1 response regulator transcription factor [Pseudomonas sp. CFBP 8773]MBD8592411.1 response regulator transcription factor [Pseudomonas sp. CFBP 8758]MBD8604377.1 response regulator transcription factor [Pseudomonas sp. CFBP 8771]MBD8623208.1 response regulator transcription factor [Pseudomonas sp. CFBP 13727]